MAKNHYRVLGVDSDATREQIKSAYRREAKKLHPDRCSGSSEPFLDVQQAYETLVDPTRRRAYDHQLARERQAPPVRRNTCPVEPLIPDVPPGPPQDLFAPSAGIRLDPRRRWNRGHRNTRAESGARPIETLNLQVSLTREQTRRPARLRLWLPVESTCPNCQGRGRQWILECHHCLGSGMVQAEHPIEVVIPAGVSHGTVAHVALEEYRFRHIHLALHIQVRPR